MEKKKRFQMKQGDMDIKVSVEAYPRKGMNKILL